MHALRAVRQELNIAMVGSVVLVCCIEFWWRHYPPLLGWVDAARFADLIGNLLLAYMASWIFFFVKDHWEKREDEAKRTTRVEEAYLGLFNAALHLYGNLQVNNKRSWQFTESDDLAFLSDFGGTHRDVHDVELDMAGIWVEEAYLMQREHYHILRVNMEHLPSRTYVIVEDINQAFLDLFHDEGAHYRYESRIKSKGSFGYRLTTLHLELFRLKNRLKKRDITITLPALKVLLESGHSWITHEERGIPLSPAITSAEESSLG